MKIAQLFEFAVDEAFSDMDQKAKNIQAGKGNATDAELRQQRITQLAANQKARNAAPAGKPMTAPAGQTAATPATAPAATTPAQTTAAPADATQQTQPAGAKGAVTGLANTVGAVSKGLGAVGGGIAGALGKIKQGYQAGKGAVGGAPAPAAGGTAPAGATAADNAEIAQLVNRVSALEKAVGIAESYKFESKFLKIDI
jgi:hypothetical protein